MNGESVQIKHAPIDWAHPFLSPNSRPQAIIDVVSIGSGPKMGNCFLDDDYQANTTAWSLRAPMELKMGCSRPQVTKI